VFPTHAIRYPVSIRGSLYQALVAPSYTCLRYIYFLPFYFSRAHVQVPDTPMRPTFYEDLTSPPAICNLIFNCRTRRHHRQFIFHSPFAGSDVTAGNPRFNPQLPDLTSPKRNRRISLKSYDKPTAGLHRLAGHLYFPAWHITSVYGNLKNHESDQI